MKNKKLFISILAGIMAAVMILGLILSILPTEAAAASSSEIQNQINELENQQNELEDKIKDLESKRNQNASDIEDLMGEKYLLDQQVGLLYTQIDNFNQQIAAYNVLIADKQLEVDAAEKHLAALNEKHKERIRAMEEDGNISYWSVIFAANSFSDLLDRLSMIEEIAASDSRRLTEMNKAALELEAARTALVTERQELQSAKDAMAAIQVQMEAKSAQASELLTQLVAKGEEFDNYMEELEDDQASLADQLADKKTEYDKVKYEEYMATATSPNGGSGVGATVTGTVTDSKGIVWVIPVKYTVITSAWGPRTHPITGEVNKFHHGIDLSSGSINGKPIYAARSGVVTHAGWYGSGGWTVKIDHLDGYASIYMHQSSYIVKAGDFVVAGQIIGYVGSTGGSTGPHLHYEVHYNGSSVNPIQFLK